MDRWPKIREALSTTGTGQATVVEATARDLEEARDNALKTAGVSLNELQKQARTGHFESVKARLAWIVISGLPADCRPGRGSRLR